MAREKICGIYQIVSKTHPERIYIGSTIDYFNRKRRHLQQLNKGTHHSPALQNHVNKYGIDDFEFSIIETFDFISKEHLISREQFYLDTYHPYLNVKKIADSSIGLKRSDETKRKIGDASKGHTMPEHVKQLLVSINTGRTQSQEARDKISKGNKGKPRPWQSEYNKGNTYGHKNKGKKSQFHRQERGRKRALFPLRRLKRELFHGIQE
jgi:group I intron endonuclease